MWKRGESMRLDFYNLNVSIKAKHILHDVSGTASSGNVLAIMGASGSGKSTLMNTLAGWIPLSDGQIYINGLPLTKRLRRRMAYVIQEDAFFSSLTLWETLYFTAMIRMPENASKQLKISKINEIAESLDIQECLHTVIGDMFVRGLSGGEKKRASIACELLNDPDVLLLDEPTTGLDSNTAASLMVLLKNYAKHFHKTVVLTIHQPSSKLYHMFNNLILLVNGHEAYFGSADDALAHFESLGFICEPHYNPADFMLDILKSDVAAVQEIIAGAYLLRDEHHELLGRGRTNKAYIDTEDTAVSPDSLRTTSACAVSGNNEMKQFANQSCDKDDNSEFNAVGVPSQPKWPVSFWTQYRMLTWRSFKEEKSRFLQWHRIAFVFIVALVTGAVFFQIDFAADTVRDMRGLIFVVNVNWMFKSVADAVVSFPSERQVIYKERASGAYRLSAYYLAKMTSELPFVILYPAVNFTIVFWMANLSGIWQFFSCLGILANTILISQGIGYCVGAATMDISLAMNGSHMLILLSMLLSGYLNQETPYWLNWARYLSPFGYALNSMSIIVFSDLQPTRCSNVSVINFPQCKENNTELVTVEDILLSSGIDLPLYCYIGTLVITIVCLRIAGYFILRLKLSPRT